MGNAHGGHFGDLLHGINHLLNFSRANPITRGFYHFIASADKIQKSVLVHFYRITRPNRQFGDGQSSQLPRRWFVPLCRFSGVIPIPQSYMGPTMDQLTFFARPTKRAIGPDNHYFSIGNRLAD